MARLCQSISCLFGTVAHVYTPIGSWDMDKNVECTLIWDTLYMHIYSRHSISRTPRLCFNVWHSSDLRPYRTLWFAAEVVIFQLCVYLLWNLNLRLFCARKCIWYPFSCDMALDGTLTSNIELVCDSRHSTGWPKKNNTESMLNIHNTLNTYITSKCKSLWTIIGLI